MLMSQKGSLRSGQDIIHTCVVLQIAFSHISEQACIARGICANILAFGVLDVHYRWNHHSLLCLLIVKTMRFWRITCDIFIVYKMSICGAQHWHWHGGLCGLSSPSRCMWSGAILVLLELFGCCLVPISLMSCMQIHLWTKTAPVNRPAPSQNAMQLARGQSKGMREFG